VADGLAETGLPGGISVVGIDLLAYCVRHYENDPELPQLGPFSGINTNIQNAFLFSHLSAISAKNQHAQTLKFVPAWSIKINSEPA
jgi:hypothetical protein